MFATTLRHVARRRIVLLPPTARCFATETPLPVTAENEGEDNEVRRKRYNQFLEEIAKEPPQRPQLKITTNENHGLYAFFRKVSADGDSSTIYETVEASNKVTTKLGVYSVTLLSVLLTTF